MSSKNSDNSGHNGPIETDTDPIEVMLDRTGCKEVHYALQVGFLNILD